MKTLLRFALFLAWPLPYLADAAEPNTGQSTLPDTSSYFLQLASGLGIVLLSILALAWLLKRINRFPNRDLSELELLASLSLGQRERVVIVRAGDTQLVLGVAPGNITKLGVLPQRNPSTSAEAKTLPGDGDSTLQSGNNDFSALIAAASKGPSQ